jgi:hypothetical protein
MLVVYAWLWLHPLTSDTPGDILAERYGAEWGHGSRKAYRQKTS